MAPQQVVPQLVEVSFAGLDQKTDAKEVIPGGLLDLENARYEKTKRISKRLGSDLFEAGTDFARRLYGLGKSVFTLRSHGATGETFVRHDPTFGKLTLGTLAAPRAWASTVRGALNPSSTVEPSWTVDSDYLSGTTVVYVVNESDGQRVIWYDTVAQSIVGTFKSTAATGERVRILVAGGKVLVALFAVASGDIKIYEYTTSSATLRATIANVYFTWPNICWDWSCDTLNTNTQVYVAYVEVTSATTLKLTKVDTGTWATSSTATWASAAAVNAVGIATCAKAHVYWCTGTGVFTRFYDATTLANTVGTTNIELAGGVARQAIGVAVDNADTTYVAWNVAENVAFVSTRWHNRIRYVKVSNAAALVGAVVETRGAGLASKPYVFTQNAVQRVFVLGALGVSGPPGGAPIADEQTGYVFLEASASPALRARMLYLKAGIAPATAAATAGTGLLVNLHVVGDPVYNDRTDLTGGHIPNLTLAQIGCAGVSFDSNPGVAASLLPTISAPTARLLSLSLTPMLGYHAAPFDGGMLMTGGVLHSFDGATMRESGYVTYPTITNVVPGFPGGHMADGTYEIVIVYERIDALGRVVQSATSTPQTVVIAGGGGVGFITVTMTMYRLALAPGETERIIGYRTANGGTTHKRALYAINSTTLDEVQFTFSLSDASIAAAAALYTDGGEADNWQPSAPTSLCVGEDRPYVVCGDDPNRVLPAKPNTIGLAPAFFPETFRNVPVDDGQITALAHRNNRLYALKQRSTFYANGNGPDALGLNDSLGQFEGVHADVGAIDQGSLQLIESGFIARGRKGFWLIGRDLERSYIGGGVDAYNLLPIIGSSYAPERNEARFLSVDVVSFVVAEITRYRTVVTELVFNDFYSTWSVNPAMGAISEATVDGARYLLCDTDFGATVTGGVCKETLPTRTVPGNSFTDAQNGSAFSLFIGTGWLHFAGLQGFERVYELLLLGEYKSDHTLFVNLYYDYSDVIAQTFQIAAANAIIDDGSGVSAYQVSIQPNRQKFEAIRLEIYDQGNGESFNMTGLAAWVGVKGRAKISAAKRAA